MKGLSTPLNVVALLITIIAIVGFLASTRNGDGLQYIWLFPTLLLPIFLVIVNVILQSLIQNRQWLERIEIFSILILAVVLFFTFRTSKGYTAQLPAGYGLPFIAIVYDVDNASEIFENSHQLFPQSGIVFSPQSRIRENANFRIISELSNSLEITEYLVHSGELICCNKAFPYQFWYFGDDKSDWMNITLDSMDIKVKKYLVGQCSSLEYNKR